MDRALELIDACAELVLRPDPRMEGATVEFEDGLAVFMTKDGRPFAFMNQDDYMAICHERNR